MTPEPTTTECTVTEAHGTKILRIRSFRRESDHFLYNLNHQIHQSHTIAQSMHTVLTALEKREYIAPRIYRKSNSNEHQYILIEILGLPKKAMKMKDSLRITPHPFLEEIIEQHQIYHNDSAKTDPTLILNDNDPLHYIKESGLVCIPYARRSEILERNIQGLLVVSYNPKKKKSTMKNFVFSIKSVGLSLITSPIC